MTASDLLALLPHARPFRFVDRVIEVTPDQIECSYRFDPEEYFYPAHFPGEPITPGVILLEALGQGGVVLQGLYLLSREKTQEEIRRYRFLVTEARMEWMKVVRPGETITMYGRVELWRRNKLRSAVRAVNAAGEVVAAGTIAGMAVPRD
jgi:3-hydroxyacyl-[acyl-carrier-protein] dehydratase